MKALGYLETKLHPTFVSTQILSRKRLLSKLDRISMVRLVLVHGAAGSGKSSLLYDWVRQQEARVGWYSLAEEDRDPHLFFPYFLRCLSSSYPGSLTRSENLLESDVPLEALFNELATSLVNEVLHYRKRVVMVLDDYHLLSDVPLIHRWVDFLVKKGPPNLSLVLVTRELPDLPLALLRAKGMLVEIRQDDLRFDEEEAAELFQQVWQRSIPPYLLSLLLAKTEGWVTGLQLVSQAIEGKPEAEMKSYLESLEGKEQFIYNYLATEVFELQPEGVRNFLKFTSIVDQFCPELASLLTNENAIERIQHLDSSRLFLVHLNGEGEWFRYHHLFRDFLRRRLSIDHNADELGRLHLQAAQWFEERGEVVAALSHFVRSGHLEQAAANLEKFGTQLLSQGLQDTVSAWLAALPGSLRNNHPGLIVLEAEVHDLRGDWAQAVQGYQRALSVYTRAGDRESRATTLEKLSLCYVKYGETKMLVKTCEEGLRTCGEEDIALRSMLSSWLGSSLVYSGQDWQKGYALVKEGEALAQRSGDPRAISWACLTYGFAYHFPQGNFQEAHKTLNHGIDFFSKAGWSLVVYQLSMNKTVLYTVEGKLDKAWELMEDTLSLAHRAGHVYVTKGLEIIKAMVLLERGDLHRSSKAMEAVESGEIPAQYKAFHYRNRLLLELRLGNVEQAQVLAEELMRSLEITGHGMYAPEGLLAVAYLRWSASLPGALDICQQLAELCETAQAKFYQMRVHQLMAAIYRADGQSESSAEHRDLAINLAEANGYYDYWATDSLGLGLPLLLEALLGHSHDDFVHHVMSLKTDAMIDELISRLDGEPELRRRTLAVCEKLDKGWAQAVARGLSQSEPSEDEPASEAPKAYPAAPAKLVVQAFGSLSITKNGRSLLAGKRIRPQVIRLLKYFLAYSDRLTPLDQFIEIFWPDAPLEKAKHNLASHISLLRKALELEKSRGPQVNRVGNSYQLSLNQGAEFDVAEFERLISEARTALAQGEHETAVARYLRAESLYQDEFLCDELYEDWITKRRMSLRNQYDLAVEFLADHSVRERKYSEAISRYRDLLTEDRLDERIFVKLLHCYDELGDRAAALREYEAFRAKLAETTGLEPTASTKAVAERLLERALN